MVDIYGDYYAQMSTSHPAEASDTNTSSNDDHSSGTPNRRSKVWEHFEPELVEVDGALKAVCRYYGMKRSKFLLVFCKQSHQRLEPNLVVVRKFLGIWMVMIILCWELGHL